MCLVMSLLNFRKLQRLTQWKTMNRTNFLCKNNISGVLNRKSKLHKNFFRKHLLPLILNTPGVTYSVFNINLTSILFLQIFGKRFL